ncbi:MAG TPA: hypothetical protein VF530_21635 [Planctomycetota bacterium]
MPPEAPARPLSWRGFGLLVLGQLVLAVLGTYPVAFHLGRGELWGGGPDSFQSLWNLWWTRTALASPTERWFHSDWIDFPAGMPLALHTFAPLKSLLGVPLGELLAANDVHSVLMLATYWWAGVAAFLLVYDWLGRVRWALLGALIYAHAPYHAVHALGHMNLASIEFLPLFFLCLARTLGAGPAHLGRTPPERRRWWAAGAGAAWALTAWVDLQYALFLGLFAPLFAWALRRQGVSAVGPPAWRLLAWGAGTAALLVAPLATLMGLELLRSGMPDAPAGSELYSLDLLAVALPSPFNPLSGRLVAPFLARHPGWYESVERVGYVGLLPLLCGLLAFRRVRAVAAWRWVLVAAWILSLGPTLRVLGFDTRVPLPSALFPHLPVLGQFRAPGRFQVLTVLALAVLVPAVLAALVDRASAGKRALLALGSYVVVALDLVAFPVILTPIHVPGAVHYLAAQPDHAAIHLPILDETPYVWMHYQGLCGKKLLIGRTARDYAARKELAEATRQRLSALLQPDASGVFPGPASVRREYQEAGVGYLVVPLDFAQSARLRRRSEELLKHLCPDGPAFRDEEHAVVRIADLP